MVEGKFLKGISIDPDIIKNADVELVFPAAEPGSEDDMLMELFAEPEKSIFHAGRIRAGTLVDIPAFVEAQIWLSDDITAPAPSDAGAHYSVLSDRPWNGPDHEYALREHFSLQSVRASFAHVFGGATSPSGARFMHHEILDDGVVGPANVTALAAGIRAINAGRAASLPAAHRRAAYEHLATHMRAGGLVPPPYAGGEDVLVAAGPYPEAPPREWFNDPQFTELTPLTITDDGHIFGHGAEWGSCHTSFPGVCVTPPSEGDHVYYRVGEVVTADGSRVPVGTITLGTGHAPTRGVTASQAAEHYDNTGTVVAVVASGEDEHGIWVSGAIRNGTPEARVRELRESGALSGDWRRIGGKMRLVAFLAVNHPGFPVPRLSAFASQQKQLSLVASGVVYQSMRRPYVDPGARAAVDRIARSLGRDKATRIAELRARVHVGG